MFVILTSNYWFSLDLYVSIVLEGKKTSSSSSKHYHRRDGIGKTIEYFFDDLRFLWRILFFFFLIYTRCSKRSVAPTPRGRPPITCPYDHHTTNSLCNGKCSVFRKKTAYVRVLFYKQFRVSETLDVKKKNI